MPFGMYNSAVTFQHLIERCLAEMNLRDIDYLFVKRLRVYRDVVDIVNVDSHR